LEPGQVGANDQFVAAAERFNLGCPGSLVECRASTPEAAIEVGTERREQAPASPSKPEILEKTIHVLRHSSHQAEWGNFASPRPVHRRRLGRRKARRARAFASRLKGALLVGAIAL